MFGQHLEWTEGRRKGRCIETWNVFGHVDWSHRDQERKRHDFKLLHGCCDQCRYLLSISLTAKAEHDYLKQRRIILCRSCFSNKKNDIFCEGVFPFVFVFNCIRLNPLLRLFKIDTCTKWIKTKICRIWRPQFNSFEVQIYIFIYISHKFCTTETRNHLARTN